MMTAKCCRLPSFLPFLPHFAVTGSYRPARHDSPAAMKTKNTPPPSAFPSQCLLLSPGSVNALLFLVELQTNVVLSGLCGRRFVCILNRRSQSNQRHLPVFFLPSSPVGPAFPLVCWQCRTAPVTQCKIKLKKKSRAVIVCQSSISAAQARRETRA